MKLYDQDEVKSILYDCIEKIENSEIGGGILSRVARGKKDEVLMVFAENIYNDLVKDDNVNLQLKGKSIINATHEFYKNIKINHYRDLNYLDDDKKEEIIDAVWDFIITKKTGKRAAEKTKNDEAKKQKIAEWAVLNYIVYGDDPKVIWKGDEASSLDEFAELWSESEMFLDISKKLIKLHCDMIIKTSKNKLDFISNVIAQSNNKNDSRVNLNEINLNKQTSQEPYVVSKSRKLNLS